MDGKWMSENKQYENEYKVQAVKLAKKIGAVNAANELQIPVNTLCGWRNPADCRTMRKNLCKFKNCDKSDILERLKNNRSNFFTVYNGYCNLSRFFGYQPAGMERSGMESG